MPLAEPGVTIADIVTAEIVDCTPQPQAQPSAIVPTDPSSSPTDTSADATIEQTGAGPPPKARV